MDYFKSKGYFKSKLDQQIFKNKLNHQRLLHSLVQSLSVPPTLMLFTEYKLKILKENGLSTF